MKNNDIGVLGLGIMGQNLSLNFESKGYNVSVFNFKIKGEKELLKSFIKNRCKKKSIEGFNSLKDFINSLEKPRKILLMVKAGDIIDNVIEKILPYLEKNDILIDGGNSNYLDTEKRIKYLNKYKINYIGCGISGGSEGALKGPSMMPSGSENAWNQVSEIFENIAAKDYKNNSCCKWIGIGGSGHYVKMIHNGIEYSIMQILAESYFLQRQFLEFNNKEIKNNFEKWNKKALKSYLLQITSKILMLKDKNSNYILDNILDSSSQKGTGKDCIISSLKLGTSFSLAFSAVDVRFISSLVKDRRILSSIYGSSYTYKGNKEKFIENLYKATYFAILLSYIQGINLIIQASKEYNWNINLKNVISVWQAGCIIQSKMLNKIKNEINLNSENLLSDKLLSKILLKNESAIRYIVSRGIKYGVPLNNFSTAISFFDTIKQRDLSANLIQAQRDFFGYHGFEKKDNQRGEIFHLKEECENI